MLLFDLLVSLLPQLWYFEVRISRSVSERPLEFEITRVDCICFLDVWNEFSGTQKSGFELATINEPLSWVIEDYWSPNKWLNSIKYTLISPSKCGKNWVQTSYLFSSNKKMLFHRYNFLTAILNVPLRYLSLKSAIFSGVITWQICISLVFTNIHDETKQWLADQAVMQPITKTCLYNFDPLNPHFYIVKLGFTGVYIIFLISAQNIDCGYTLEPLRWGGSNEYPQSMFWAEIRKISEFFIWKFSFFFGGKIFYIFE